MSLRIGVVSLGCAKNLVDTEIMLGYLTDSGYELVSDSNMADFIVINTCGFIGDAKEESINTILEMAQLKQTGRCQGLIVTGCLAQRYSDELMEELPEIDALLGTNELDKVDAAIHRITQGEKVRDVQNIYYDYDQKTSRILTTGTHSAYLKIAEGCNHTCAFCAIPRIRGKYRSRSLESIVEEARDLIKQGVQELVVIAQDTTVYGRDLEQTALVDLLRKLSPLDVTWIRLLYTYPTSLSDDVLSLMSSEPRLVKYVDLPLQHVSSSVLKRMKRPGDFESTVRLIDKIRATIPGVSIRSSFIVGFPGETEEDFQQLLTFLETARLDRVGIFKFSPEEGTAAESLSNQVPESIKEERYAKAMAVQQGISLELNKDLVGKEIEVMVEGLSDESDLVMVGRHQGQAPDVDGLVYFGLCSKQPGEIVRVRIVEAHPYDLVGEVVE